MKNEWTENQIKEGDIIEVVSQHSAYYTAKVTMVTAATVHAIDQRTGHPVKFHKHGEDRDYLTTVWSKTFEAK